MIETIGGVHNPLLQPSSAPPLPSLQPAVWWACLLPGGGRGGADGCGGCHGVHANIWGRYKAAVVAS